VRLVLFLLLIICVVLVIRYLYITVVDDNNTRGRNPRRRSHGSGGIDTYYAMLGCSRNDTDEQIKRQYRKLAKQYHPDAIQGKGLAEDFIKFANQRIQDIQQAYEIVMEHRRMHHH
jgi:DnaJ-domain-containing protein 1